MIGSGEKFFEMVGASRLIQPVKVTLSRKKPLLGVEADDVLSYGYILKIVFPLVFKSVDENVNAPIEAHVVLTPVTVVLDVKEPDDEPLKI